MEFDWKDIDMPESSDPTDPLLAIFSEASVKSSKELLMADFLMTTADPLDLLVVDPVIPEDDLMRMSEAVVPEDSSVNPLSLLSAIDKRCFSSSDSSLKASISSISAMDSFRSSTNFDRSCSFRALRVKTIFLSHFCANWIPYG